MKGKLYLIPSPLGDNPPEEVIPAMVLSMLSKIKTFIVEETRTARRYLSKSGLKGHINELEFYELNEHTSQGEIEGYISLFDDGNDVALISEAGLPAVADPGAQLVALAHKYDIPVVPFSGPSSLMLALMASGLNGQSFVFCGYLPAKREERRLKLKNIERSSASSGQAHIFIETPYRNDSMLSDILDVCFSETKVCVAINLTLPDVFVRTATVGEWRMKKILIGKNPSVFIIQAK